MQVRRSPTPRSSLLGRHAHREFLRTLLVTATLVLSSCSAPERGDGDATNQPATDVRETGSDTSDAAETDTAEFDAAPPPHDDDACPSSVVPNRFGFRWKNLNHRVSEWNVELRGGSPPCPPTQLHYTAVGGPFSDNESDEAPVAKFGYRRLDAGDSERVGTAIRSVDMVVDARGRLEGTRSFDRDDLNLEEYGAVVPIVAGFRLSTDTDKPSGYPADYDPAHGYNARKFGVSVRTESIDSESVEIAYEVEFRPGLSVDRSPHNRAVPHARIAAGLDVLLVGTSQRRVHRGESGYSQTFPVPETGAGEGFPHADREDQVVPVEGTAGAPAGLFGFQSFAFELVPQIECDSGDPCPAEETCTDSGSCTRNYGPPGFYVREISADLRLDDYSRESGEATFLVDGFASNSTELVGFYSLEYTFQGQFAWLQVPGAGETVRLAREFETGSTEWPLASFE